MGVKHGAKEVQMLSLNPDARILLREQADRAGISISAYVERLILEKDWEYRHSADTGATDTVADGNSG